MESPVKLTLSSLELTYWKVALLLVFNFGIELNFEQVIESFYWYLTSTTEQKCPSDCRCLAQHIIHMLRTIDILTKGKNTK